MMIQFRPILFIHGILLLMLAAAMLIPMLFDYMVGNDNWVYFGDAAFITGFAGGVLFFANRGSLKDMNIRQAFIFTTTSYIVLAAFSGLPLYLALDITMADAFFESTSGITSTGSTVLTNLDTLPHGILLWRSIMNAYGGVGIVVMAMAILPMLKIGGMQLFRTESSDTADKMLPSVRQLSSTIMMIFLALSAACSLAYWLAGMEAFDAVNHALTTISTGGFSTHDASIGHYQSAAIEWIAVIFMLSGAFPLILWYQVTHGRPMALWRNSQIRWLVAIILVCSVTTTLWLTVNEGIPPLEGFRMTMFNFTSIITTTGFASTDYMQWGTFAIMLFFVISVFGGCTGSTSGGIKMFRLQILFESARIQINQLIQPHGVFIARYQGKPITKEISASVLSFIIFFGMCFTLTALVLSLYGLDYLTAMSAAAEALANVGPGLGNLIGPAGNFAGMPSDVKWILSAAMILGRLELFTVLVMLSPLFWRD
jgi:trk system potassium uptake protein TrkH